MAIKTLYTAVGRFERRTNGCNRSCPIILLGGQEYMVDMQEMVIWSMQARYLLCSCHFAASYGMGHEWNSICPAHCRYNFRSNHTVYGNTSS